MARKRSRQSKATRAAERSAPTSIQNAMLSTAMLQERANKKSNERQSNLANRYVIQRQRGLGYPVSVPGRAAMTYNLLGGTDEGRVFSLVHLHPCGEYVTSSCGIPDESQVSSVTPSFRGDSIIGMNRLYFENPPTLPASFRYDIQMVVLPIPEVDYIFRVRINELNTGWSRWVVRRTTYFSSSANGTANGLAEAGYSRARVVGRGITVHFDAPALADQGRLIAGQIRAPHKVQDVNVSLASVAYSKATAADYPEITLDPVDAATVRRHIMYLPQSETELTVQDSMAAQWEARFGSYIPHRFVQPVQNFTELENGTVSTIRSSYNGPNAEPGLPNNIAETTVPKTYYSLVDNSELNYSSTTAQKFYYENPRTWGSATDVKITPKTGDTVNYDQVASLTGLADTGTSPETFGMWGCSDIINHYTSVQFFMGIQHTSQLHVKTRLHMECEVHARDSPVTPFIHRSPTIDRRAMEMVAYVAQNQAHVFFASDNDLSSILQSIGKILPGLLQTLQDSGIPVVESVGKVGNKIGRGLKDLLSGF